MYSQHGFGDVKFVFSIFNCFFVNVGHSQRCSRLTSGSVLRYHSWWYSRDLHGMPGIDLQLAV